MKTEEEKYPLAVSMFIWFGLSFLGWGVFIDAMLALVQFIRDF